MLCAVCQKTADTKCGACNCSHYCSRECQKSDWKSHKKFCKSFVIKEEEEEKDGLKSTRRSIVAAKDLERGDYILEELPLFQVSRAPKQEKEKKDYEYCVTCGTNLVGFLSRRCSRCKWPVCVEFGRNCEVHKIHAENECEILASKKIDYESLAVHEDRRILLILRAQAMKEKKPEVWNELMKRADEFSRFGQDSVKNREEMSKLEDAMKKLDISSENTEVYKKFFSLLNLTSILWTGFRQRVNVARKNGTQARVGDFLYPLSNYFSFSCAPNCNFGVEDYPNFKIQIRAARDIQKGEELTIHYPLIPLDRGTIKRRRIIKERFGYLCKCERCSDPTEFGTFFSGIVCQVCRPPKESQIEVEEDVGYFLPFDSESKSKGEENEKDSSSLLQCNNCKTIRPQSFFKDQLTINTDDDAKKLPLSEMILDGDESRKLMFSKFNSQVVHPNYFKIHKIRSLVLDLYHEGLSISKSTSETTIQRKAYWEGIVNYGRSVEELERKLLNGAVMYEQAHYQQNTAGGLYMLAQIQSHVSRSMFNKDVRLVLDIMGKFKECIKFYKSAIDFQTNLMPTSYNRTLDLEFNKLQLKSASEQLGQWDAFYRANRSSFKKL